jgi:hypothetical protein
VHGTPRTTEASPDSEPERSGQRSKASKDGRMRTFVESTGRGISTEGRDSNHEDSLKQPRGAANPEKERSSVRKTLQCGLLVRKLLEDLGETGDLQHFLDFGGEPDDLYAPALLDHRDVHPGQLADT